MSRQLWAVAVNRRKVAVVAAPHHDGARRIVLALVEHGDLPGDGLSVELSRCEMDEASETVSLATSLGCADRFLACLGDGMFLTWIGGLGGGPVQPDRRFMPREVGVPDGCAH